jgi:N-glycosidase YbiA
MIKQFQGKYRFLSNFYPSTVHLEGYTYPTVEHAYQAAKTLNPDHREAIRLAPTPSKAKYLGRSVTLRGDWDLLRIIYMQTLLEQKFALGTELAGMLLATEDDELVEGNTWGDTFWGVCRGIGENNLGKLLMVIRSDLRSGVIPL